jgi:hypothetical protein
MPSRIIARTLSGLILVAILATGVCLGKTKVQVNKKFDFTQFKTYQWFPPRILKKSGLVENDQVVTPLIKAAVNRELAARNLTEVADGADLKVSVWAVPEAIATVDALIYPGAIRVPAGSMIDPVESPIGSIGRYNRKGTIVVNLIDSASKTSAWAALDNQNYTDVNNLGGPIEKAVTNIFKKYPVKPR